ncbi:MAG: carbon-nitrogen hydrolase family protein [Alphaproteobacteria bacterium]
MGSDARSTRSFAKSIGLARNRAERDAAGADTTCNCRKHAAHGARTRTDRRGELRRRRREPDDRRRRSRRSRARSRWLLLGSLAIRTDEGRLANRSVLFAPDGQIAARYDKIHMFDVAVSEAETYQESKNFRPGDQAVLARLPWGVLGMSVCYDVRFPHLYRALAKGGAHFLSVPSAFTKVTGQAHWHVLLRARAIETGCYMFAPAQGGRHENGRETFGHSLVVDPWGRVIAEAGEEPAVVIAKVDPAEVEKARARIPALSHDREFKAPTTVGGGT